MIKNIALIITLFMLVSGVSHAQDEFTGEVPEGMEAIRIGGSGWIIIPKGAKTRKVGAQIIVEGDKEYMSRRFMETNLQLQKLEKMVNELKAEIEILKEQIQKKATDTPAEKEDPDES